MEENKAEEKKIPKATHYGELKFGDIKIPCAVLDDSTRVLAQRSVARALKVKGGGTYWQKKKAIENGAMLPEYVSARYLQRFINPEIRALLSESISYETRGGTIASGIKAETLPKICDIWITARENGALSETQAKTAGIAYILLKGFAHIGIIALVDEATGFQEIRDRKTLQALLDKYLRKELAAWAKQFPDEFYKQIFRLQGWEWRGMSINRPSIVGKITNDIVYERLAHGILDELKRREPITDAGHRKHKFHQWLTGDIGCPALSRHIYAVIGLMRVSTSWRKFHDLLERAFPKKGQTLLLPLDFDEIEDGKGIGKTDGASQD